VTAARGVIAAVDRHVDLHTHSSLTDGHDPPEMMADAAARASLQTWGLSDHVRADSAWLPDYVRRVRALSREGVLIRVGVEAKILDRSGRLDLPPHLPELDYVLVADHQFPGRDGPQHPREVAADLAAGKIAAADVIDELVAATCRAVRSAPLPAIVVHPFSLLPKLGCDEQDVQAQHCAELADACLAVDAAVEINEKWRCPSPRLVTALAGLGVRLVAGSDAHRSEDVGRWRYLDEALAGGGER
jgi:putative hydrolase